ncbi:hypothetical protein HFO99_13505 [Rhizobium leguminosarum]|uniref:hypothetical protein n=1 Tax=Rhizobium leguminosarum TaxID=384 RepID=UPI001C9806FF|nr:hypothetical protein [Rhizobium leguminosarum]MBY5334943.1 hypothetical protein [Rhizobium leguminosarum]
MGASIDLQLRHVERRRTGIIKLGSDQRSHGFNSNVAAPCKISAKAKVDPTMTPTLLMKRALREAVET